MSVRHTFRKIDKELDDERVIDIKSLIETKKTTHKDVFAHRVGDTLEVEGIVAKSVKITDEFILFYVQIPGDETLIPCIYRDVEYPLKKYDRLYGSGEFETILYKEKEKTCLACFSLISRFVFDLNQLLIETYPLDDDIEISEKTKRKYENDEMNEEQRAKFEELLFKKSEIESKHSLRINKLSEKIVDYAKLNFGEDSKDLCKCLCHLSTNGKKKDVENFTEFIFGEHYGSHIKEIQQFLFMYRNDCLKRPFQLLGVPDSEIESIRRPLYEAYDLVFENPYRIVEISEDVVKKIFSNHLLREPEDDWIYCGRIARFIYKNYKTKKWTSTPIQKLISSFPSTYNEYKDKLVDYFCSENLNHWYYNPILWKEQFIAKEVSELLLKNNEPLIPIYPGLLPTTEQDEAIRGSIYDKISIITGPAGVGKTKTLANIGRTLIQNGFIPLFLSYTGAAVQRIKHSLKKEGILDGCKVFTIHLAIAMKATFDEEIKISHVIFDEFSMVDLGLFYDFMNTYRSKKLSYIFSGDINQLEPISAGNVMQQFLKTPMNVYRLTKNFRSEEGIVELIDDIVNEDRIQENLPIDWIRDYEDYQFNSGGIDMMKELVRDYYNQIPQKYRNKTSDEEERELFQSKILKHINKYTIVTYFRTSADEMNDFCQRVFMKRFPYTTIDRREFHLKDRIMNLKNNYSINVMNGEIGKVIEITDDYIGVEYGDEQSVKVPYFGSQKMKKIKSIRKKLGTKYNPNEIIENKPVPKSDGRIEQELTEEKNKFKSFEGVSVSDIDYFFDTAKKYPFAIFGYTGEQEFLNLSSIQLAYCVTVRKAQGNQYPHSTFLIHGKVPFFINRRVVYTGASRAEKFLRVVSENETLINSAILTGDYFTYENLAVNINNRLPEEMRVQITEQEDDPNNNSDGFNDSDGFDDIDLSDIM